MIYVVRKGLGMVIKRCQPTVGSPVGSDCMFPLSTDSRKTKKWLDKATMAEFDRVIRNMPKPEPYPVKEIWDVKRYAIDYLANLFTWLSKLEREGEAKSLQAPF